MLSKIEVEYMVYEVSQGAPAMPAVNVQPHILIVGW